MCWFWCLETFGSTLLNLRSRLLCCFFVIYELRFEQRRGRGVGIYIFFRKKGKKNSDAAALRPTTASEWLRPPLPSRRRRAPLRERRELLSLLLLFFKFRERFCWSCDVFLVKCLFILLYFCSFLYMRAYCNSVLLRVLNHQIWIVSRSDGGCVYFLLIQYVFLPMLSCVFDVLTVRS